MEKSLIKHLICQINNKRQVTKNTKYKKKLSSKFLLNPLSNLTKLPKSNRKENWKRNKTK